ncbi:MULTISPECIES: helix-turn-helix domain-containing protein [Priestia]|uniref:helix-turn-helix domain-containing protein n=1 Tax=Priestia TaxID=2800373 RepID=UPI00203C79B5|nr:MULTISPECIES: helix-turn-helix domain-containing protein [Priestia]MCM3006741.1 helix-turn-helix domain-containing protein [Priestia koreensis]MDR7207955.1 excisionase family DNA binding protein [Priestia megaterium]
MNIKLEVPEDTLIISRKDLRETFQEMMREFLQRSEKEEIMTIREAADYLKVSIPTVRNMIANKEIPFFQKGQIIRLNSKDVQAWMWGTSKE